MKIAILTEYTGIGGGETNAIALASRLKKYNCDVVVYGMGEIINRAKSLGISVQEFDLRGKRWFKFVPIIRLSDRNLCKSLMCFDIVHAYSINVIPRLFWLYGPKIVWTNHGFWENATKLKLNFMKICGINKIVAVNDEIYDGLPTLSNDKSKIYLGVDFVENANAFNPRSISKFQSNTLTITCVARFQKIKGQDLLVKAINLICQRRKNIRFIVNFVGGVSDGDNNAINFYHKTIAESKLVCKDSKNVTFNFHGYIRDVRQFYTNSDIVVIPSLYESFSMVCVEALSHGKPVIAPDIGGPKFIVSNEPVGYLFKPGDVTDLSLAIEKFINNEDGFYCSSCINRAMKFHIDHQASSHIKLYKEIIGR